MTRVVLVRHGESAWQAENRYSGTSDIPMTPRGFRQAERLATWAKGAGLAAVWTSTLSRARLTGQDSATAAGVPLRVDTRLRELDFGDGEGLTSGEMDERFPEHLRAFRADPVAAHLPGGEDPAEAARRFTAGLRDIAAAHPGERVLVVAHATAIRLALCELLGVPLREYRRLFPCVRNCAVTELRLTPDGEVALLEFNTPVEGHEEVRA